MDALYVPSAGGFRATQLTRGPWDPAFQHAGPPSALLAREASRVAGIDAGAFARLTFEILRPIPVGDVQVRARVTRPGRQVERIEGELLAGGDVVLALSAWRMRTTTVELPEAPGVPPPPGPDGLDAIDLPFWPRDEVAYHRALEWRLISGIVDGPGPAAVWSRLNQPLVAGEQPGPVERLLVMADAASGVSAALDWTAYGFLNVDYSVHLERPPAGEWTAMDAETTPGTHGSGQCVAQLFDTGGRVGWSTQSLLITRR